MKSTSGKETLNPPHIAADAGRPGLKIAYLAPEIPAMSATFVYNEILALEARGVTVLPVSVHLPGARAEGVSLQHLAQRTVHLYGAGKAAIARAHLNRALKSPWRYLRTLATAVADTLRTGGLTHIGKGLIYRFMVSAVLAELLQREACDHLHVHFAHIPTDLAMYAAGLTGIPFSFTAHANDLFERGWLLDRKVARSRFAVTISEFNRRFLAQHGADPARVHVVHCGVAAAAFAVRPFREMGDPVRIGAIGRFVEKKGFEDLITACGILRDQGFHFRLELVGDGPLRQTLVRRTAELGLVQRIAFRGAMAHDDVPAWMQRLDLFALPCKKDRHGDMDGIPVVLMEAMLTGVPVVTTRLSGIPELVIDGETGVLAPPGEPAQLARAIVWLCSPNTPLERLCRQAAEHVRTQFDLQGNADRLLTLFKENHHDETR